MVASDPVGRLHRALNAWNAERERCDRAEQGRRQLLSGIKRHRNATESRVKLINSGKTDTMLKPDRDLYELAERIERD